MLNPSEAETVEELAEIGVAFLELDLHGERCSILHGDEQHPRVVIQCFSGFTVSELDLFDWLQWTWDPQLQRPGSCLLLAPSEFRGRHALLAGLFRQDGEYLGFLHADRDGPFSSNEQEKLARFAEHYGQQLGLLVSPAGYDDPAPPAPVVVEEHESGLFHREWAWMDYV
ncbi:hypothetical protein IV102_10075 [bacterium]|nr:hypothetical protein [bacterium]